MAVAASITGGTRRAIQLSCLPSIHNSSLFPVSRLKVFCGVEMLDVGFTATLK